MEQIWESWRIAFGKVIVWVLYILLGIMTKFSFDLFTGKKLNKWQAIGSTGIAVFFGILSSAYCVRYDYEQAGIFIVPPVTMLSEKLIIALFAIDFKKELAHVFRHWADKLRR